MAFKAPGLQVLPVTQGLPGLCPRYSERLLVFRGPLTFKRASEFDGHPVLEGSSHLKVSGLLQKTSCASEYSLISQESLLAFMGPLAPDTGLK